MDHDALTRMRQAIRDQQYTFTEHAYDEMDADNLDVLDAEAAILTGKVRQVLTDDPRGSRFVMEGKACDQETPVGVVVRFIRGERLLVITVYEIK